MARVRGKDTQPELIVRRVLNRDGYRFRLHRKDLPGRPDIVLPKYQSVIFVHGCFWHGHKSCPRSKRPSSNSEFWDRKLDANMDRDLANLQRLEELGWSSLVIWECETKKDEEGLSARLNRFLSG